MDATVRDGRSVYRLRVHWGYWMFYAQKAFHHSDYCWDGGVTTEGGRILSCSLITYDGICGRFGPSFDRLTPLPEPHWRWFTRHANYPFGGVVFEVEGTPDTVVRIRTRTANLDFTIARLIADRQIAQPVGGRYSHAKLEASFDGDDFRNWRGAELEARSESIGAWRGAVYAGELGIPTVSIQLTDWAPVRPGDSVAIPLPSPRWRLPASRPRALRVVLSAIATGLGGLTTTIGYTASLNGREQARADQPFQVVGHADHEIVGVEELEIDLPEAMIPLEGAVLTVTRCSGEATLFIGRVWLEEIPFGALEVVVCPAWVSRDEPFSVELLCRTKQRGVAAVLPPGIRLLDPLPDTLAVGRIRYRLVAERPLASAVLRFVSATDAAEAVIEQVYATTPEPFPMRVGMDNVVFPPSLPERTLTVFKYLTDHRIGDHYSIRGKPPLPVLRLWIEGLRAYGIHYSIEHDSDPKNVRDLDRELNLADDPLFTAGYRLTECDGPIFGYDQKPEISNPLVDCLPSEQRTMRTAYEAFEAYWRALKNLKSDVFGPNIPVWGHVSTISHYVCYRADIPVCVTQLNKSHNTLLMSEARGALRAAGRSLWATYIAEGAHVNPENDRHLRMWSLSLNLSYVMGASFADDEQHLLRTWHEHLYGPRDRDLTIRIETTQAFNRYVKTHPRRGELTVRQAVLMGRYACDVADGLCDPDGSPVRVWRNFGGESDDWAPGEPEYGFCCLDKLFPGVWLHSLEQSPEAVRRWYSGSPFGETELISIDAPLEALQTYGLLLVLGWNTMDDAQYDKLKRYVTNGGRLLMAVPHATRNEGRTFLSEGLEPMHLVRDGDFSDLFGVRVDGPGAPIRAIDIVDAEANPATWAGVPLDTSTHFRRVPVGPEHAKARLANVTLHGAQPLACDGDTGQPILTRNRLGAGEAYLLTTWTYPGNAWLRGFVTEVVAGLAERLPADVVLEDLTGDVYYTRRVETETGQTRIHLLNTDWTEKANKKQCQLRLGDRWIPVSVREGTITEVVRFGNLACLLDDSMLFLDAINAGTDGWTLTVHGHGVRRLSVIRLDDGQSAWREIAVDCGSTGIATFNIPDV